MKQIPFLIPLLVLTALTRANPEDSAKSFLDLLTKEDFAAAHRTFDPAMSRALPADSLAAVWKGQLFQTGPLQETRVAKTAREKDATVVFLACRFARATGNIMVTINKDGAVGGLWFGPTKPLADAFPPPPYSDKNAFTESDLTIGHGPLALPGTLAIPKGPGPFPGLVLVHGSGANDRDETIGPNKPFRDIAHGLASRGIAVLRYDKRTKIHSIDSRKLTVAVETVDDAVLAAAILAKTDRVDPKNIFVLGHSLGGMLIPRIAQQLKDARGFIVMAGTTRPLEDLVLEQVQYICNLDGVISPDEQKQIDHYKSQVARIKELRPSARPSSTDLLLGVGAAYWLDLRDYNPAKSAAAVTAPLLILQGERDYQVTVTDFKLWQKSLVGRPNVQFKLYPRGNHLLMDGQGPCTPAEYEKPAHVPEAVIADLKSWISTHKLPSQK